LADATAIGCTANSIRRSGALQQLPCQIGKKRKITAIFFGLLFYGQILIYNDYKIDY
jgi:hypothetical protein